MALFLKAIDASMQRMNDFFDTLFAMNSPAEDCLSFISDLTVTSFPVSLI